MQNNVGKINSAHLSGRQRAGAIIKATLQQTEASAPGARQVSDLPNQSSRHQVSDLRPAVIDRKSYWVLRQVRDLPRTTAGTWQQVLNPTKRWSR
jgi:hypothetical protein